MLACLMLFKPEMLPASLDVENGHACKCGMASLVHACCRDSTPTATATTNTESFDEEHCCNGLLCSLLPSTARRSTIWHYGDTSTVKKAGGLELL